LTKVRLVGLYSKSLEKRGRNGRTGRKRKERRGHAPGPEIRERAIAERKGEEKSHAFVRGRRKNTLIRVQNGWAARGPESMGSRKWSRFLEPREKKKG